MEMTLLSLNFSDLLVLESSRVRPNCGYQQPD